MSEGASRRTRHMRRKRAQGVKNIPAVSQYHSCYRFPATVRSLISGKRTTIRLQRPCNCCKLRTRERMRGPRAGRVSRPAAATSKRFRSRIRGVKYIYDRKIKACKARSQHGRGNEAGGRSHFERGGTGGVQGISKPRKVGVYNFILHIEFSYEITSPYQQLPFPRNLHSCPT